MKYENREVVLKALVGSHNYNLNTETSDEDFKLFVAPTFEDLYHGRMFSTAKQSDTMDYDVHDIRQLGNLLWKANINFIEVLFSQSITEMDYDLQFLFDDVEKYARMNLPAFYNATYGMHKQKMSELFKGTEKTKVLVEKFGYDTKQACHALRCLLVLKKYSETGYMEDALWFRKANVSYRTDLLELKAGEWSLDKFMHRVAMETEMVENARTWYMGFEPKLETKEELDAKIMQFVKAHL